MVVEVAQVVTFVSGAAGAVGAVGAASLGLKAILTTFKALRESGLSVRESMDGARRIVETQQYMEQRESMTPEDRQAEKEAQAWAMDTPEARQASKEIEWDSDTRAHYEGLEDDFNETAAGRQRSAEKDMGFR